MLPLVFRAPINLSVGSGRQPFSWQFLRRIEERRKPAPIPSAEERAAECVFLAVTSSHVPRRLLSRSGHPFPTRLPRERTSLLRAARIIAAGPGGRDAIPRAYDTGRHRSRVKGGPRESAVVMLGVRLGSRRSRPLGMTSGGVALRSVPLRYVATRSRDALLDVYVFRRIHGPELRRLSRPATHVCVCVCVCVRIFLAD